MPAYQALYLSTFKDMAGAAAGVAGSVRTVMMAAGSALASAVWDGTPRSFYANLASLMLVAQLWFWLVYGSCPPPLAEEVEEGQEGQEKKPSARSSPRRQAGILTEAALEVGGRRPENSEAF